MHDKQVRRRRVVLALLVAVSLILLTAYFGESPSSPLHSVQRGIVDVFSPVEQGASTVLTPFKDIAGWFSDTFNARSQVKQLRKENDYLRQQLDLAQLKAIDYSTLQREVGLDQRDSISAYQPVGADVILRSPTLWYQTIEVDAGSADGVRVNDPVIGDGGLVGKVTLATSSYAFVTLITDHSFGVGAEVQDQNGDYGVLQPETGNPSELLLSELPKPGPNQAGPQVGQQVVTSGFKDPSDPELDSLYPPGIPIGQVSNANQNNLLNNGQIEVSPVARLRYLTSVQILTRPHASTQRAQVP